MPKLTLYNAHFKKPDGEIIAITEMKGPDLRTHLSLLIKQYYDFDYKFLTYGLYDLRYRTKRISKFVRQMIPLIEVVQPNTDSN